MANSSLDNNSPGTITDGNDLRILQWNCRGLKSKLDELRVRLRTSPYHVLALAEGSLPDARTIPGYIKYNCPAIPTFPHGSAALYIKAAIPQAQIDTATLSSQNVEVVMVEIKPGGCNITVACVYIRSNAKTEAMGLVTGIAALAKGQLVICGDFNTPNVLWGSRRTTRRGRNIAREAQEADLALANTGTPTFFGSAGHSSAIDLTWHSSSLPVIWQPAPDTEGSDHLPITVVVKGGVTPTTRSIGVTDWNAFRAALRTPAGNPAATITSALRKATKVVKVAQHRPDPDLKMCGLMAQRRRAQRRYRRTRTIEDEQALKTATGRLRGYTKQLELRRWRRFCDRLDPRHSSTPMWHTIATMSGARPPSHPLECLALRLGQTMEQTAEQFADRFTQGARDGRLTDAPATPRSTPPTTSQRTDAWEESRAARRGHDVTMSHQRGEASHTAEAAREREGPVSHRAANTESGEGYAVADALNLPFTLNELRAAIARLKPKSAPGPDGCTNQALRNTPTRFHVALLAWFNQIWLTGEVPREWKMAWVVPIPKAGKPAADLGSYRPISLIPCSAKLFERLVQGRLLWFLESKHLLPPSMLGFRGHLSAQDAVLDLTTHLKWSRSNRRHTAAVFLDLTKAFDSVDVPTVLDILKGMGLRGNVQRFLKNYLLGRSIAVKLKGTISAERQLGKGLPQGSTLSPLLFNCAMTKLAEAVPRGVSAAFYADDICMWNTQAHIRPLIAALQGALNAISEATRGLGLTVSAEKSRVVLFRGRPTRQIRSAPNLEINKAIIPRVRTHKFLGVTLDERGNGVAQASISRRSVAAASNAIRRLCGTRWGCRASGLLRVHQALVVNRLMYSLPYLDLSAAQMEKMERAHRKGIKTALGVPRWTETSQLFKETTIIPLEDEATCRLVSQLTRLHLTSPGQEILQRVEMRDTTREAKVLQALREELNYLQRTPLLTWTPKPPWTQPTLELSDAIPEIQGKRRMAECVARARAQDHINTKYENRLQVFTDGSVDKKTKTATAACHIPEMNIDWSARINHFCSSTLAELAAITEALRKLAHLPAADAVILVDSRAAIQRLQRPQHTDASTKEARDLAEVLINRGQQVALQWIPAHVGLRGNERADQLAKEAHQMTNVVEFSQDPHFQRRQAGRAIRSVAMGALGKRAPCPTRGMSRAEEGLLYRLRTESAFTREWLSRFGAEDDPLCVHCGEVETVGHILLRCQQYAHERADLERLQAHGAATTNTTSECARLEAILAPRAPLGTRRRCLGAVLKFLRDAGLQDRL